MAMAGRFRTALPLIQNILRAETVLSQRSFNLPGSCNPNFMNSEFSRSYATGEISKEQKIKVPLALFGVTGNFATALFLAASKANLLEKVESEVLGVVEASKKSLLFGQFIKDLSVPAETRIKAVQDIFSEAGFSDITKNFLAILAGNGRLQLIETIANSFVELTMAHRGVVKATVTTVIPLPSEEEKQLKETLQEIIGHGKMVKLEQKDIRTCVRKQLSNHHFLDWSFLDNALQEMIDPSILGGLVVEFSQKVFDMSIRTRARQMEKFLRDPINFNKL